MQLSLRKAARICYEKGCLTHEAMHNYFMSGVCCVDFVRD